MQYAEKLKLAREQKGLTQNEVAERIHVTRQTVSKWENGVTSPDLGSIVVLCNLYETTLDYLLRDEPQMVEALAKKERAYPKLWVAVCVLGALLLIYLIIASFAVNPG